MRHAAAAVMLLLAGCADGPWAELAELVTPPDPPVSLPPEGPALRLWIGGSPRGHADLLQELGERRIWRTPGGLVVATEGARVVATAGLSRMLAGTRTDGPDPLIQPTALIERPAVARRVVDLMRADRDPANMRFGLALECRLAARPLPAEDALLVEEHCRGRGIERFVNRFWVDPASETVFRSEQWIGPDVAMLRIEPLSPAAPAAIPLLSPAR